MEKHGNVFVVREDLLTGGTKRRFIDDFVLAPHDEFVYASTAYGGAQIALAHACAQAGKRAVIFVAKRKALHPRTLEAKKAGAKIVQVPMGYLSNLQFRAKAYCEKTGALLVPFGFDTPESRAALAEAARMVKAVHGRFDEVWAAAGSGTLIRALQQANLGKRYFAVAVGRNAEVGKAKLIRHPMEFAQDARIKPPFPSCSNYDAKVWEYVSKRTARKVLFWNVMG